MEKPHCSKDKIADNMNRWRALFFDTRIQTSYYSIVTLPYWRGDGDIRAPKQQSFIMCSSAFTHTHTNMLKTSNKLARDHAIVFWIRNDSPTVSKSSEAFNSSHSLLLACIKWFNFLWATLSLSRLLNQFHWITLDPALVFLYLAICSFVFEFKCKNNNFMCLHTCRISSDKNWCTKNAYGSCVRVYVCVVSSIFPPSVALSSIDFFLNYLIRSVQSQ